MRIVNVLVFAVCIFNIASANGKMKKKKDVSGDALIHQASSNDHHSSNWVPLVLRRTGYGEDMDNDNDYHGRDNVHDEPPMRHFPPFQRSHLNQQYDPVGKAYVRVEMEHPIYTGRSFPSTGGISRPSSGVISVTSNAERYTVGSYGNQGQGSVTPLALNSDYGASGTAAAEPVTSNANTGYSGNPTNYPGYGSSAYTDYSSSGQNDGSNDYSNVPSGPTTAYGPHESTYDNYDAPSYYQTGPISTSDYGAGTYGSSSGLTSGYGAGAYGSTPDVTSDYTISPAPSSGYVGYGGTFHNYGQHTTFPVAYRGRLPQLFVVGAYGTPWSANQIEQEAGYYLYR